MLAARRKARATRDRVADGAGQLVDGHRLVAVAVEGGTGGGGHAAEGRCMRCLVQPLPIGYPASVHARQPPSIDTTLV